MDWLKKIPIGQYVAGKSSWLRLIDPRIKFSWVLMFLLTPVLAGPGWRVSLVVGLLILTFFSYLPSRIWWRSLLLLVTLSAFVGILATLLPTGDPSPVLAVRPPNELTNASMVGSSWEVFTLGPTRFAQVALDPLVIDRRSVQLGLNASTLVFTVVHSVNLMLLTTAPEDLTWTLRWFISPLALLGIPVERISFQLLLSLRFLPLIQEEFQNLLKSLATRAVNLRKLGFKASFGLLLSVAERLLANILLRAEQGADALVARGGFVLPADQLRPKTLLRSKKSWVDILSIALLLLVLCLRGKYGAL